MPDYRYFTRDLRTGTNGAELPLEQVRWGSRLLSLGQQGELSASLALPEPATAHDRTIAALYVSETERRRHTVVVERDGVVMGEYVLWSRTLTGDPPRIDIRGAELWSYYHARRCRWSVDYINQDQGFIARDQLTRANGVAGGNIGVTVGSETTGVTRLRTIRDHQDFIVAEFVEELSAVLDGFDFSLKTAWSAGSLVRTFAIHYPRQGRTAATSGHVFELGRNVLAIRWDEQGQGEANWLVARSDGHGEDQLRAISSDPAELDAGFAVFETATSYIASGITSQTTLQAHAVADREARSNLVAQAVTLRGDIASPQVGEFEMGDECRLQVPPSYDARWPNGLQETRRIVGVDVDVPDSHTGETVTLLLDRPWTG